MFPALPSLPSLSELSSRTGSNIISIGGGSGGLGGPGGGPVIGAPPIGGGGGSGRPTGIGTTKVYDSNGRCVSGCDSTAAAQVTDAGYFGLPSIPWGRLAAFLLGLLLIAAGLYLIKPIQQQVQVLVKHGKAAATALAEA